MTALLGSLFLAYLLGSLSPSYLLGKLLKGIDLREHGSGNVGATNAFRVLGKGPGIATLLIDMGKGYAAVKVLGNFFASHFSIPVGPPLYQILLGVSVISGHNWTLFLKFKGGKGVAATFGVFLAIVPRAVVWTTAIWVLVTFLTKTVALGSLSAALILPLIMIFLKEPPLLVIFGILAALSIFYTHRSNIIKIFLGKINKNS